MKFILIILGEQLQHQCQWTNSVNAFRKLMKDLDEGLHLKAMQDIINTNQH